MGNEKLYEIKTTYHSIPGKMSILCWEPVEPCERSQIAIVCVHGGGGKELNNDSQIALAKRGFTTLHGIPHHADFPTQYGDLKAMIDLAYSLPGVKKVVLSGSSRGASLMSSYQKIAENGIQVFQGPERLLAFPDVGPLTPADGLMMLDANYGCMNFLGINPALIEEGNSLKIDPTLDPMNPDNGFDPVNGSKYTPEFKSRFFKAQVKRYHNLLEMAAERLYLIENGKGNYLDNEPFIVPEMRSTLRNPKLFCHDMSLLSHTSKPCQHVHPDGSVTTEIVHSVKVPRYHPDMYQKMGGAWETNVREFLLNEVKVTEDFGYDETSFYGIKWDSSFRCTAGSVKMISCPLLTMGFTGGYEYLAAEFNYDNSISKDKTLAFTEGGAHSWLTAKETEKYPGQWGNTLETSCDYIANWLTEKGRFID